MARFKASEADKYGGQGGGGYFSLADDGDTAQVRFCYNTVDDVEGYSVHEVEIDGRKRYVECLRDYNEPMSKCPLCSAGNPVRVKLFIPVYDVDEDKIKIWERGKKFFNKISSLCSRYTNADTDLVNNVFEIERNGKKGSTDTTYEIYNVDKDDTALEDLSDADNIANIADRIVLQKSFEDLEFYREEGYFPPDDDEEDEKPQRRNSRERGSRERDRESAKSDREERRTPARRNRDSKEDKF